MQALAVLFSMQAGQKPAANDTNEFTGTCSVAHFKTREINKTKHTRFRLASARFGHEILAGGTNAADGVAAGSITTRRKRRSSRADAIQRIVRVAERRQGRRQLLHP
jgi:type IV secretory pathway TrbL component